MSKHGAREGLYGCRLRGRSLGLSTSRSRARTKACNAAWQQLAGSSSAQAPGFWASYWLLGKGVLCTKLEAKSCRQEGQGIQPLETRALLGGLFQQAPRGQPVEIGSQNA